MSMPRRLTASLALAIAASMAALPGCSRDYGYSRSAFGSKFVDKTVEQAQESAGKADAVENPDPNTVVLIYRRKTFNQENANAKDASVRITFKRDASGVTKYADIDFQAE